MEVGPVRLLWHWGSVANEDCGEGESAEERIEQVEASSCLIMETRDRVVIAPHGGGSCVSHKD